MGFGQDLSGSSGSVLLQPAATAGGTNKVWSGLALYRTGATSPSSVTAIGTTASASAVPGRVLQWDSFNGATNSNLPQSAGALGSALEPQSIPSEVPSATPVVIQGSRAFFTSLQPPTSLLPSEGLFVRKVTSLTGTPTLDTDAILLESQSAARSGGGAIWTGKYLTSSKSFGRALYVADTGAPSKGNLTTPLDFGVPVVGSDGQAFVGVGDAIVRFDPLAIADGGVPLVTTIPPVRTSPVLGKAAAGRPALGHAVTASGVLAVFDASATGTSTASWTAPIGVASTVETHPAFDCNRRVGAARSTTGILYVPFLDGNVVALIVDSPALMDANGAWPKYQRTSGNAGNDDTAFFPTNWPCP